MILRDFTLVVLFTCSFLETFGQVDTIGLSKNISEYNIQLKENWDSHFTKGGKWEDFLSNRNYALDCKHIFLFEYFVRLGKTSVADLIDNNYTVFAHGCQCGNNYLVRKGISENIDLSQKYGDENMTALMLCIKNGNLNNSELILSHTNNINLLNNNLQNELQLSAEYLRDTQFIATLLELHADAIHRNVWGINALETAYYYGDSTIFHYLFDYHLHRGDTMFWQSSKLMDMSIIGGDTSFLERLFPLCESGVNVKKSMQHLNSAIDFAVFYSLTNKYRSEYTSDTTIDSYNTKNLDIALFRTLMRHGININEIDSTGKNILFKCVNLPDVAIFLFKSKITFNQIDFSGKTFLQYYIDDLVDTPVFTLDGKVDYKIKNRDYTKELETLKFYIDSGATVGKDNKNGWKYMMASLSRGTNPYLLKYLQEQYSDEIK